MSARDDYPMLTIRASDPALWTSGDESSTALDEIDALRAWKAEALVVLAEWDEVWRAAGHPGNLGTSKAAAVRALFEDVPVEPAYPQPELFQ